jgi:hypothetical protein
LYHLVNDEGFLRAVPFDLDEPLAVGRYKYWVEAKFFLTYLEKPEDCKYKLGPILVDIEPLRYEPPESIKLPYSYKRSVHSEAQDKSASILSGEDFPRICTDIEPGLGRYIGVKYK